MIIILRKIRDGHTLLKVMEGLGEVRILIATYRAEDETCLSLKRVAVIDIFVI